MRERVSPPDLRETVNQEMQVPAIDEFVFPFEIGVREGHLFELVGIDFLELAY